MSEKTKRKTIIRAVIDFFERCPEIKNRISTENLGDNTPDYCIETIPTNPIVKSYVDGSAVKQFLFVFAGNEVFGENLDNQSNSQFYETVENWIEEQNAKKNLPELPGRLEAQKIVVLTNGYVLDNDETKARYQIQCQLIYYKPA